MATRYGAAPRSRAGRVARSRATPGAPLARGSSRGSARAARSGAAPGPPARSRPPPAERTFSATMRSLPRDFDPAAPRARMQFGRPSLRGGKVPVTAKLSKRFYEVLGEDVANELVAWFNAVDATYRADLRELNELNFARFHVKLEQRLAELDARWRERWAALDAKLEQRLAALDAKLEQRLAALRADLVKWMFAFWAPTAVALFATGFGVVTLLLRR